VRVRRGLYRVRGFPTSRHDDMREKWMAVGMDKAVLSHESALALLDLSDNVSDKLFLRRLVAVAPDRWVLKGALALDFRFHATTRSTRDMDLGRADDEDAAVEDFAAAQEFALDDFVTFAARRTDALDDADDFRAIRLHVTAELASRVFDQFVDQRTWSTSS
jgi:hypothetical protein